jgi:hypothetical protein
LFLILTFLEHEHHRDNHWLADTDGDVRNKPLFLPSNSGSETPSALYYVQRYPEMPLPFHFDNEDQSQHRGAQLESGNMVVPFSAVISPQ